MSFASEQSDRDQTTIDRLVDGELSEEERRAFLERLDRDPDQWRSVALGFLESQCCGEALGGEALGGEPQSFDGETACGIPLLETGSGEAAQASQPSAARPPDNAAEAPSPASAPKTNHKTRSRPTAREVRRAVAWLPIVASLAVAFSLGFASQRHWSEWTQKAGRPLPTVGRLPMESIPLTRMSHLGADGADSVLAGGLGDPQMNELTLPLVQTSDPAADWLSASGGVVSPELEESLNRYGHRVVENRRVYPVRLNDGRRVLLPVDDVRLKFVGNRGYR